MPRKRIEITAAICTYERHDLLADALASLREQSLPARRYQIVVVDNSPPSARREEARGRFDGEGGIRYLTLDTPGLSNARNVAAEAAEGEIIAYLDDDAVADPRWLEEVLAAFGSFGEEAGIVGGRVDPIWTVDRPEWLSDSMLGALTIVDLGGERREKRPDEWIAGANFSVRVPLLLAMGGFATNLGRIGGASVLLSNEDVALVRRFADAGLKTIWAPDAIVAHRVEPERVTTAWFRRRYAWQAVSDFVADPDASVERAHRQWENLTAFISRLPPRLRTPRGIFEDLDDARLSEAQVGVAYSATVLLLAGFQLGDRQP